MHKAYELSLGCAIGADTGGYRTGVVQGLLILALLLMVGHVRATTCGNAININPANLPIANQNLVCGGADDLNDTNVPGAICGTGDNAGYKNGNEALYTFTPTTSGPYNLDLQGQNWNSAMVFIGCPTLGNCLYGDGTAGSVVNFTVTLNAGTQYFIWFDTWPTPNSPCPGTFSLSAATALTNDDPCTATPLPVNASCTFTTSTNAGASVTPGVPAPTCSYYNGADVWFSVVVPANGSLIIDSNTGVVTDGGMALYTAPNCSGTFTEVACDDDASANGFMPMITAAGLTPGSTVYIRFWEYGGDNNGTFSICAQSYNPPPPPANDNPCNATVATVNPDLICTYETAGTLVNATATGLPAAPCNGTPDNDVWFSFTATNPTHYISLNNVAGNEPDLYHAVYSGPCNSLINLSCSDANNSTLTGLTIGQTYWIRVYSYWTTDPGDVSTFDLCITTPPPPPGCGDVFYDPGGTGNYPDNVTSTVTICPTTPGDLVVLDFTSFDTENGIDELLIYDGNTTGAPLIGTYSGNTLPPTVIASNATGCLTAVFDADGSVDGAGWAANISCINPPAGDCVYVLRLNDSNGNGWGSSAVRVRINGGAWTSYTATGASYSALIGVNLGDFIEFEYIATGPGQGQNSYTISKLGQLPYFSSAIPPVAGITFTQTVACGPPPAQPQDCLGGITICNSSNILSNSQGTGQTEDLDDLNQGCLSSGERQGTWYFFSPTVGGTVGFTISPSDQGDDYDFALWGPFASAQCPSGDPVRCSYAAPAGNTGLGNGAMDNSEGAGGNKWVAPLTVIADQVYVMYIDNYSSSGNSSTLTWDLGGSSLDCTTLPVELISLEATARDPHIDVTWATATEQNSSHFYVQRSFDNQHFTTIGTVGAAGNAQFRTDYLFVDQNPFRGVNYYRLEQVDNDGAAMRTHTVVAELDGGTEPAVFPNPVTDVVNVTFNSPMEGEAELCMRDALGRTVAVVQEEVLRGPHRTVIPSTGIADGWYNLRIELPNGAVLQTEGFIKR